MSEISDEIHFSRDSLVNEDRKEKLALGMGSAEITSRDQIKLIPDKTPGREASIRPRSPFRDFTRDSKKSSSTRSAFPSHHSEFNPEDSVRIEDRGDHIERKSMIRSVYDISRPGNVASEESMVPGLAESRYSPDITPSTIRQNHPIYYSGTNNIVSQLPSPPPGYSYYPPQLYPIVNPHAEPEIPEYDKMTPEDQQEARIIFKSKFTTMRENYPEMSFDDYDPDLPLNIIHKLYEQYLKKISVKTNSTFTRAILALIFLSIEAFSIKVLNIDVSGYTEKQLAMMDRYDNLLIELGEKYTGSGGNWPVEARLFVFAIFNAFLIVGAKWIAKGMGWNNTDGIINTINGIIGGHVDAFVEKKPEPIVDPVTKTTDLPTDTGKNLMDGVETLMALAGNTFGVKTTGADGKPDIATTIGSIGSNFLPKSTKGTGGTGGPAGPSANPSANPSGKSKRGVRFGSRDGRK